MSNFSAFAGGFMDAYNRGAEADNDAAREEAALMNRYRLESEAKIAEEQRKSKAIKTKNAAAAKQAAGIYGVSEAVAAEGVRSNWSQKEWIAAQGAMQSGGSPTDAVADMKNPQSAAGGGAPSDQEIKDLNNRSLAAEGEEKFLGGGDTPQPGAGGALQFQPEPTLAKQVTPAAMAAGITDAIAGRINEMGEESAQGLVTQFGDGSLTLGGFAADASTIANTMYSNLALKHQSGKGPEPTFQDAANIGLALVSEEGARRLTTGQRQMVEENLDTVLSAVPPTPENASVIMGLGLKGLSTSRIQENFSLSNEQTLGMLLNDAAKKNNVGKMKAVLEMANQQGLLQTPIMQQAMSDARELRQARGLK